MLAACGAGREQGGAGGEPLVWDEGPELIANPALPDDGIAHGTIRNGSDEPLALVSSEFEVIDAEGEVLDGAVAFLSGFVKPIEGFNRGPDGADDEDMERLGRELTLDPGEEVPATVSWRESGAEAAELRYPEGSLELP